MATFGMAGKWGFPKYGEVTKWFGPIDFSQEHGGRANWFPDFETSIAGAVRESKKKGIASHLSQPLFLDGCTLEEAAKGSYREHWRKSFENAAAALAGAPTVLRIAVEPNGDWMPWSVDPSGRNFSTAQIKQFCAWYIQAFRLAVDDARDKIPGVVIDWNVNRDTPRVDFRWLYPGDQYCDIVSIDWYFENQYNGGLSGKDFFAKILTEKNGIGPVRDFAAEHGKPFAIPEFGMKSVTDRQGADCIDALTADLKANGDKGAGFAYASYFQEPWDGKPNTDCELGVNLQPASRNRPLTCEALKRFAAAVRAMPPARFKGAGGGGGTTPPVDPPVTQPPPAAEFVPIAGSTPEDLAEGIRAITYGLRGKPADARTVRAIEDAAWRIREASRSTTPPASDLAARLVEVEGKLTLTTAERDSLAARNKAAKAALG